MAETFLQLTDVLPSSYELATNKFVRVNNAGTGVQFWNVSLFDLEDVVATGAYAPSTGDGLVYHADGKWKPGSVDVYSAGNGLNKVGLGFNVQATGGLTADGTGVFISDIANISGTYGNASTATTFVVNSKGQITSVVETSITAIQAETITNDFVGNVLGTAGQISVVGGSGNNSTATINLVATGVTAATYGNATTIPQITVDAYGRIQNVDLVTAAAGGAGGGNVLAAFKHIEVSGQATVSADAAEDTLTFVAGGGIVLTTSAGSDAITFTTDANSIVSQASVNTLSDVNTSGATDGQSLIWDNAGSKWVPGDVTPALANSGVVAGTYGSSGNITAFTVDSAGIITSVSETSIIQGDITSVVAGTGLTGGGTSGEVTLNLEQTGVLPGVYGDTGNITAFTVDATGRITNATRIAVIAGDITSVVAGTGLTGGATSGDATLSLATSGVSAGVYGNAVSIPQITVDATGRVTSVAELSVTSHTQSLSWNAASNILAIGGGNTVDLSTLAEVGATTITALTDVGTLVGITNGQALLWNTANTKFEYGSVSAAASDTYKTITVNGQSNVVASGEDTLTLVAGAGVQITTDPGNTSVTINSTATGNLDFGSFGSPVGFTLDMGAF